MSVIAQITRLEGIAFHACVLFATSRTLAGSQLVRVSAELLGCFLSNLLELSEVPEKDLRAESYDLVLHLPILDEAVLDRGEKARHAIELVQELFVVHVSYLGGPQSTSKIRCP